MPAPDTLPANFDFSKQGGPPDTLPANFNFGTAGPEQLFGAGVGEYVHQMGGFFEGLWNKAKGAVGALLPDDPSKAAVEAPVRVLAGAATALHNHIQNLQSLQDKAEQSLSKGDIADFLGHMQALSVEGVMPGIGQAADAAKVKWDAGDKVGATADAAALTSQALLMAKSGDLAKGTLNAGAYTVAGARAGGPKILGGLAKAGAGEVIAKVPGMELPARFGLQYPALREVSKGIGEFAQAGRKAIMPNTAATEAAAPRPMRASRAPSATAPPTSPAPETPPPSPGKTAADLLNEEMAPKEAAPAAPPVPAKAPGQTLAESYGETWHKLSQDDKLSYAQMEGAQASSEARNPPPPVYAPRGPEHYGVKAAEVPPQPAPSAPAPTQPASAAPTAQNMYAQAWQELPPYTPPTAKVQPIRPPTTETVETPPQKTSATSTPKPASGAEGAIAKNATAKADRIVGAIQEFGKDFSAANPNQPFTTENIANYTESQQAKLVQLLKSNGYLKNTEKFPNLSWPYIVTKLRQAEYSAR